MTPLLGTLYEHKLYKELCNIFVYDEIREFRENIMYPNFVCFVWKQYFFQITFSCTLHAMCSACSINHGGSIVQVIVLYYWTLKLVFELCQCDQ